ncbi:aminotransferase class IV [Prodigiosinella confusarubida]|uniref:Aminodeoxychorismate lyase n=1 Tax=Serratia sp. (strain ATCC 39006) TaxID=104623 RepID=A0A2I5TGW2_SERS3|nr:aminotransferase class IV [Serratia sp. ATCC 39006]AUG99494.1 aminotransferase class IV [Serratia sp. ATCC 39006]AUH03812.1 aminotransferase class IV [Serratia sp. ATCC 39006]
MSTTRSTTSSQAYLPDPRNNDVLVYINGEFVPKNQATVSVFDSGFVLGDGVWEGVRLVKGKIVSFDLHINRIFDGAKSIELDIGVTKEELKGLILKTLEVNNMTDGAHVRLMISRGKKHTPNQDPRFALGQATIVIVAEYKVIDKSKKTGIKLYTSTFRCSAPDVFDLRLNSHSRLNLIQALIQAINAGADEALMLDPHGFVASCNSTNFFIVRGDELWTSTGKYNFNGITHKTIKRLAEENGIKLFVGDYTLAEIYTADEAFLTGTLGGITPVIMVDGKGIGAGKPGPMTAKLSELYESYINN